MSPEVIVISDTDDVADDVLEAADDYLTEKEAV